MVFEADGITELIQQLPGTVLFHGMTPPFDKKGFEVHNILIVGPAPQPDCPLRFQVLWSEFGISLPWRYATLSLFSI
jgi:hypothetical protein